MDRNEFYLDDRDDRDDRVNFEAIIWKLSETTETIVAIEGYPRNHHSYRITPTSRAPLQTGGRHKVQQVTLYGRSAKISCNLIYDKFCKDYKKKFITMNIWKAIGEKFGLDAAEAEKNVRMSEPRMGDT